MVELIRKLTANYDEKEYTDWLWSNDVECKDYLEEEESRDDYFEVATPDDKYVFINKKLYRKVDASDILKLTGKESFKDMDIMLEEIACSTGYSKKMLTKIFNDAIADGETYADAFDTVAGVSHEMDW